MESTLEKVFWLLGQFKVGDSIKCFREGENWSIVLRDNNNNPRCAITGKGYK